MHLGGEVTVGSVSYYNRSPLESRIQVFHRIDVANQVNMGDFSLEWFKFLFEEIK